MKIKIQHSIDVDKCIAAEIKELNNKHDIFTLHSCCGHDKGNCGFIAAHPDNIADMKKLGYVRDGNYKTSGFSGDKVEGEQTYNFPVFRAKSVCRGRC